jgi:hypothetical protein
MSEQPEGFAYALQYLTGQAHALSIFCAALARSHPDRDALLVQMDWAEQRGLAQIEALPLGDAAVNGFRFLFDNVRKAMGERAR